MPPEYEEAKIGAACWQCSRAEEFIKWGAIAEVKPTVLETNAKELKLKKEKNNKKIRRKRFIT